jgi:hypothetical protein
LGDLFPSWGIWLFATGIVRVILFTNPQARVLRGMSSRIYVFLRLGSRAWRSQRRRIRSHQDLAKVS